MAGRKEEEDQEKDEEEPAIPTYNPQLAKVSPIRPGHSYNLRPRPKPAPRKLVRKVEISTSHFGPSPIKEYVTISFNSTRVVGGRVKLCLNHPKPGGIIV